MLSMKDPSLNCSVINSGQDLKMVNVEETITEVPSLTYENAGLVQVTGLALAWD